MINSQVISKSSPESWLYDDCTVRIHGANGWHGSIVVRASDS